LGLGFVLQPDFPDHRIVLFKPVQPVQAIWDCIPGFIE
jgi:hypothetical protein